MHLGIFDSLQSHLEDIITYVFWARRGTKQVKASSF